MSAPSTALIRACPIPDPRPQAISWHRTDVAATAMPALPLHADESVRGPHRAAVPDPRLEAFVRTLLIALIDVIQGRRPPTQLIRWVSDDVIADLILRARLHQRSPQPLAVRSFRIQLVTPDAAEVSARLLSGARYTAAAVRLDRLGERWICSVADLGPLASVVDPPLPRLRDGAAVSLACRGRA